MFAMPIARLGTMSVCLLAAVGLLAGCGGGLRVTTAEVDDAQAIRSASAFHLKPVEYDFERSAEWEISDAEWPTKTAEWTSAYNREVGGASRPVYTLGEGAQASDGAVVEFVVTDMNRGMYAFFVKTSGWIRGILTITDASSGNVIFRGSVDSPGTTEGTDRYSYEGRVKVAHLRVARDVEWLINRELD